MSRPDDPWVEKASNWLVEAGAVDIATGTANVDVLVREFAEMMADRALMSRHLTLARNEIERAARAEFFDVIKKALTKTFTFREGTGQTPTLECTEKQTGRLFTIAVSRMDRLVDYSVGREDGTG